MNSPVAVLIAVSLLFVATWSRDSAGPRPERLVASRGYIEADVLAAARASARETAHLVRSTETTNVEPVVIPPTVVEPVNVAEPAETEAVEVVEPTIETLEPVIKPESVPAAEVALPIADWARVAFDGTKFASDRVSAMGERAVTSMRATVVAGVERSIERMRAVVTMTLDRGVLAAEPSDTALR